MKLEAKHFIGYLNHGLKLYNHNNPKIEISVIGFEKDSLLIIKNDNKHYSAFGAFKPILRPLSDLTKEIEVNGEKFIPLIELASIGSYSLKNRWIIDERNLKAKHESGGEFYFASDKSFIYKESDKWKDFGVACNQFDLFQKLNEWHIDFNGLIENGSAIDINTLKE